MINFIDIPEDIRKILEEQGITDIETLQLVLADPLVVATLPIKAGPLAKLRQDLGLVYVKAPPVGPIKINLFNPETSPVEEVLRYVIAHPDDSVALVAIQRRVPRVLSSGKGLQGILVAETMEMLLDLQGISASEWPYLWRGKVVSTWDDIFASKVRLHCPFTGEPIVDGFTTKTNLDWNGIPEASYGLAAYLADQHKQGALPFKSPPQILNDLRGGGIVGNREYVSFVRHWNELSPAVKLSYAEKMTRKPVSQVQQTMTYKSDSRSDLSDVLLDMFNRDELERFARRADVYDDIPTNCSPRTYADNLLYACKRKGLMTWLVQTIKAERPSRDLRYLDELVARW
jgi:hypothetical protein